MQPTAEPWAKYATGKAGGLGVNKRRRTGDG